MTDKVIDKIYIVSLDWSDEHIASIWKEIDKVGLPDGIPYEVLGIDGRALTTHHMQLMGIDTYKDWNLNTSDVYVNDKSNRYWQRDVTMGEVGCTLSHIAIWEDAYKNGYDNILVFEDDFVFEKSMDWKQLDKVKSMNYDLFYLGRLLQTGFEGVVDTPIDDMICRPGYSYQTHALILSKSGIKKLVENHLPKYKTMLFVIDEFLPTLYCNTPRTELNYIFEQDMNTFALNECIGVQYRTEMYNNSLTQPN